MKKIYETLYSADSKDNIRIWRMEQNGAQYRTTSGLELGNLVATKWSSAEPKNTGKVNATTAIQQASAEIESQYAKKLKSGYFRDKKDVYKITFIEPMLAQPLHKLAKQPDFANEKWGMQCKFNGNRCIATKDGLFSRTGERYYSVPHIEGALKEFFELWPEAVLDGELFNNEMRTQLNEINKLIRKTKHISEEDFAKSKELVKYYVYDGYNSDSKVYGEQTSYIHRKTWIDLILYASNTKYLPFVETIDIKSEKQMNKEFQRLLADQQEGAILRRMDAPYEHKRSKYLVKVKVDDDSEATIVDITDGDGNWKGAATNVTLIWKGKVFDGVFKGKYEKRADILKDKKNWIGKEVTFLYMGLTGLGTPNFARVDPDNCFKNDR
jgi:ATP-dependent DNA ligase